LLRHQEDLENAETSSYVYNLTKFEPVNLPSNVMMLEDLPEDHDVRQYAKQRGLEGTYTLLYFPGDPLYAKRLIVPFTFDGGVVGWTGRHINPPDKTTPKYLHKMSSGYVFNIDRFADSEREIVIVVEGVFDAILVDGIAVLGNHVTPEQAHLIEKLGKRVILCPDRDKPGKELIDEALALGWEVSFPPWHKDVKDAADAVQRYGRLATVASIIKHATSNKIKAQVKAKML
jgi:DNA primase